MCLFHFAFLDCPCSHFSLFKGTEQFRCYVGLGMFVLFHAIWYLTNWVVKFWPLEFEVLRFLLDL